MIHLQHPAVNNGDEMSPVGVVRMTDVSGKPPPEINMTVRLDSPACKALEKIYDYDSSHTPTPIRLRTGDHVGKWGLLSLLHSSDLGPFRHAKLRSEG